MSTDILEFMFMEMTVGVFTGKDFPCEAGLYRYEPYRGMGHYMLAVTLQQGGKPRCYYDSGDARVSFTVHDCPEYGLLRLDDFERISLPETGEKS